MPLSERLRDTENALQLKNLSKTRWSARAESINAVNVTFEAIIESLNEVSIDSKIDAKTIAKAFDLRKRMLTFDFIFCMRLMNTVLYKCKVVTEALEKESFNFLDALKCIDSVIRSFEDIRKDIVSDKGNAFIEACATICKNLDINAEAEFALHHRKRTRPVRLDPVSNPQTEFTMQLFYRKESNMVLDRLI